MLSLTPIASEAIRQLTAQTEDPRRSGVRISVGQDTSDGTALQLALVEEPEPADKTLDDDGATVYLQPDAAGFLEDKVLDAQVDDGRVMFLVRDDDRGADDFVSSNGRGPQH